MSQNNGNVMTLSEFTKFIASVNEDTSASGGETRLMFECKSDEMGSIHLFYKTGSDRFVPFGRHTHSYEGDDIDPKDTFDTLESYLTVGLSYLEALGFQDFRLVYVETL
jgi:hypothetical protein